MLELKLFTEQVEKMRHAQTRYFELAAIARKTHTPEAYKSAKDTLTISKQLEKDVDAQIVRLNANFKTMERIGQ